MWLRASSMINSGPRMRQRVAGLHQALREVRREDGLGPGIFQQRLRRQDALVAVLDVRDDDRQFRCGEAASFCFAARQFGGGGQLLQLARDDAFFFQGGDQAGVTVLHRAVFLRLLFAHQQVGLRTVVAQDQFFDVERDVVQDAVALGFAQGAGIDFGVEPDLDVDFMIGAIDAGGIVDRVGEDVAAGQREFDTPILGCAEVAAFGHDLAAQLVAVDPDLVVGAVLDLRVQLTRRLDVGANAAVVEQVDRGQQDRVQQLFRRQAGGFGAECGAYFRRQFNGAHIARPDAAALGNQALVVVFPAGARQCKHALAFGERGRHVRCRVDENMAVIEGRDQLQLGRQQHAVAEHVARHVADADHGDRGGVEVMADLVEMALDCFPRALGGDAEFLVVVAIGAARCKRIAQPEAALDRDAVGDVGEGRGALVGRHHQVGVGVVVADGLGRRDDLAAHAVVGDVEQAGDEEAIDCFAFGRDDFTRCAFRHRLADEAALGAGRHDDGVLDHLRLDQAQHFGAVIFHPVGPAQATARDRAAAQMHAFEAAREHENFTIRTRLRQERELAAVEFENDGVADLRILEVGRAQGRQHQVGDAAQDVFGVGVVDVFQVVAQGHQGGAAGGALFGGRLRVEAQQEAFDQGAHVDRLLAQAIGQVAQAETGAGLAPVAGVGADQLHFLGTQAGFDH